MKLVIPCAGRGTRLRPLTLDTPKSLININGKTILENLISLFKTFNFEEIIIIVNYMKEKIMSKLGNSFYNIPIRYVEQKELKGLAHAINLTKNFINDDFMVVLGDEIYLNTNHDEIINYFKKTHSDVVCGIMNEENPEIIKKNYSVKLNGDNISEVIEKPTEVSEKIMGVGTWIFNKSIFDFIKQTPPSKLRNEIEIADVLQKMIQKGKNIKAFLLDGKYVNLNYYSDLNLVNDLMKGYNCSLNPVIE
ncbi:MAG: sugar phosphate nucleotidyltransferase [Candidatus Nanoarchaeia archaeon]|jgi:glucose-1-phosphate thymidylyltransferase